MESGRILVLIGGYCMRHLYGIFDQRLAKAHIQTDLFLSHHFVTKIDGQLNSFAWGQHLHELPPSSFQFMENPSFASDWLQIKDIQAFNHGFDKSFSNIRYYPYHGLRISDTPTEYIVAVQDLQNPNHELFYSYPKARTTIIDTRLQPNIHHIPSLRDFPDIEDFLADPPNNSKTPVLISGLGPSGLWAAEICYESQIPFQFFEDLDESLLFRSPRNSVIVDLINANKHQYQFPSEDWMIIKGDLVLNCGVQNLIDQFLNHIAEMGYNESPDLLAAFFNKDLTLQGVARVVLCIGFQAQPVPLFKHYAEISYKNLTLPNRRVRIDIAPVNVLGSVMHQLLDCAQAVSTFLEDAQLIKNQYNGIQFAFFSQSVQQLMRKSFLGEPKNCYVDDLFFDCLRYEILYQTFGMTRLPTREQTKLWLRKAYRARLDQAETSEPESFIKIFEDQFVVWGLN